MLSKVGLFCILFEAVAVLAADVPLSISNPNGLQVVLSPDTASIGVMRALLAATSPPPTTPLPTNQPTSTPVSGTPSSSSSSSSGSTSTSSSISSSSSTPMQSPIPTSPPATSAPLTTGKIGITLASVMELDSNMTAITSNSFVGFNNLNIGVTGLTPPRNQTLSATGSPGVQASCQSLSNRLFPTMNSTVLTVTICAILSNGTATYDTEANKLAYGQLTASIQLESWPWAQNGSYLQMNLTLTVQSGKQLTLNTGTPVSVGLGVSDAFILLSTKVIDPSNSIVSPMPTGYPSLTQNNPSNNMATVTAILQRSSTIVWNAVIEPGYQPTQQPPGPVAAADSLLPVSMIHFVTAVMACWMGFVAGRL